MDIKVYLAEQGLTPEEISAIVGSPAATKAMSAALSRYEEGMSAKAQADAEKAETATFWEQKTTELEGSVNRLTATERRAAKAEAEAAHRTAYLKSLKEQGYDIPDEMIGAAAATPATAAREPATGQYVTREDFEKGVRATAPDLVSLTALSNEYRSLFGTDYVSIEEDFKAAQQAGKPLREFARSKYNFEGKRTEIAGKKDQERIDALVNEKFKAREAELVAKYGSNPETRTPMPSKFDTLVKREGFKEDSWKSEAGRKANRVDRLKRFENLDLRKVG